MTRLDPLGFVPTDLSCAIDLRVPIGFDRNPRCGSAHQGKEGRKRATPWFSLPAELPPCREYLTLVDVPQVSLRPAQPAEHLDAVASTKIVLLRHWKRR